LRKIEDVDRDIDRVETILRTLLYERKLISDVMEMAHVSSQLLARRAIEKMMKDTNEGS
jgi:hypothetical protein